MKLNEFGQQVNELGLRHFVGDYGAAALKQLGNRLTGNPEGDMSTQDKVGKEKYIQNLIGRASTSLASAIQTGLVDPKLSSASSASAPAAAPSAVPAAAPTSAPAVPAAAGASPKASSAGAVKAANAQKTTTQNINAYVQNAAKTLNAATDKSQKIALTKELINFMADRKGYPEWENALGTVKQVLARNKAGGNMLRALQTGQRVAEAWQVYYINMLLEAVNLSWGDVGLELLKESKSSNYIIAESKFTKLNNIFESMLSEQAESISSYLKRWLAQYPSLKGVNLSNPQIDKIIDNVQATYGKDRGKAALSQLANATYSLIYSNPGNAAPAASASSPAAAPAAAPATSTAAAPAPAAAPSTTAPPASPAAASTSAPKDQVQLIFNAFNRLDMQQKQKLLAMISGAK